MRRGRSGDQANPHTAGILEKFLSDHPTVKRPKKWTSPQAYLPQWLLARSEYPEMEAIKLLASVCIVRRFALHQIKRLFAMGNSVSGTEPARRQLERVPNIGPRLPQSIETQFKMARDDRVKP
jgi:hypothetical protein